MVDSKVQSTGAHSVAGNTISQGQPVLIEDKIKLILT